MNNSPADCRFPLGLFSSEPTPRLHDSVAGVLCARHYSRRTEQAFFHCIRRITPFHGSNHSPKLTEDHANRFLSQLAIQEGLAASTQKQALAAVLRSAKQQLGIFLSNKSVPQKGDHHG
jgi:integrase-like protein